MRGVAGQGRRIILKRSPISFQRSALCIKTIGCIIIVNQSLSTGFDKSLFLLIADCSTPTIIRAFSGSAAINVNREPKIMVSYASFAAPPHPGRVVLRGLGLQGLASGAAL
jgi:hypothetical protein